MKHEELDKLEQWLRENNWPYDRRVRPRSHDVLVVSDQNLIIVYRQFPRDNEILFDAICHQGSYGYEKGLLEIMGECVVNVEEDGDSVAGYLTAEQVVERFKKWLEKGYEERGN